jgi:hypothetical protein
MSREPEGCVRLKSRGTRCIATAIDDLASLTFKRPVACMFAREWVGCRRLVICAAVDIFLATFGQGSRLLVRYAAELWSGICIFLPGGPSSL